MEKVVTLFVPTSTYGEAKFRLLLFLGDRCYLCVVIIMRLRFSMLNNFNGACSSFLVFCLLCCHVEVMTIEMEMYVDEVSSIGDGCWDLSE